MVLKYHISPFPASTENWTLKIWEASNDNPGAEVHTQTIPTPHTAITTITVSGLDKVVHVVRLYGAVSAALLHEFIVEPLTDVVTAYSPIYFKIGDGGANTPVAGTDTYTNSILVGLGDDDYTVYRNGYGVLHPNRHYTTSSVGGSFELVAPDVFGDEEEFLIQRKSVVIQTPVNDSVVGKWFAGFIDVSADTVYSNTHLRKLIRFAGTCKYTFQALSQVPVGYMFAFQHFGTAGTGTVEFLNGPLKWPGGDVTSRAIPSRCEAGFVWDGTKWNVVYMVQSTWADGTTPQPGQTLGVGRYAVGDVPSGDPLYTITHNLAISGDYLVFWSLETQNAANYHRNNKVCGAWHHHATDKANKFHITLQEITGEVQDVNIVWMLVKI